MRYTPYSSFARGITSTRAHAFFRNGSDSHSARSSPAARRTVGSWRFESSSNQRAVSACASGFDQRNARSSSSFFTEYIPSNLASGANTKSVSRLIFTRFSGLSEPSVRMLCKRSASFTMITRTSCVIARNISRRSSACTSFLLASFLREIPGFRSLAGSAPSPPPLSCVFLDTDELTLLTLVSPSTMRRTARPNLASMDSNVTRSVSSTVSCRSPAITVSWSIFCSASMPATATGCVMNGSPDLRRCPSCASYANCTAWNTSVRSNSERYDDNSGSMVSYSQSGVTCDQSSLVVPPPRTDSRRGDSFSDPEDSREDSEFAAATTRRRPAVAPGRSPVLERGARPDDGVKRRGATLEPGEAPRALALAWLELRSSDAFVHAVE